MCTEKMTHNEILVEACQFGDLSAAKNAIANGADVNVNGGDYTPLHWATQEGHIEIVGVLLDNGADINSHDKEGFTALQKAVGEDYPHIVRYLLNQGADINDCCDGHGTPLHTACAYGRLECANILLSAGADASIKDNEGKVPVEYASLYGHREIFETIKQKTQPSL